MTQPIDRRLSRVARALMPPGIPSWQQGMEVFAEFTPWELALWRLCVRRGHHVAAQDDALQEYTCVTAEIDTVNAALAPAPGAAGFAAWLGTRDALAELRAELALAARTLRDLRSAPALADWRARTGWLRETDDSADIVAVASAFLDDCAEYLPAPAA